MKSEECCKFPYVNVCTKETVWSCFDHMHEYNKELLLTFALVLKRTLKNPDIRKILVRQFIFPFEHVKHLKHLVFGKNEMRVVGFSRETKNRQPDITLCSKEFISTNLKNPCFIFTTSTEISIDDICKNIHTFWERLSIKNFKVAVNRQRISWDNGSDVIWKLYTEIKSNQPKAD
jgi:hypothetical protein